MAAYTEWRRQKSRNSATAAMMTGKYILAELVDLGGTLHDHRLLSEGRLIEICALPDQQWTDAVLSKILPNGLFVSASWLGGMSGLEISSAFEGFKYDCRGLRVGGRESRVDAWMLGSIPYMQSR